LFVVHEKDADRARQLISEAQEEPASAATWTCPKCGTEIEGQFSECWNCAEAEDA
jgi:rubrerythrin